MSKPANVLVLDIETSPILAFIWDTYKVSISPEQIYKDRDIMSYSAKWRGKKKMFYYDRRNDPNCKRLILKLKKLLNKADVVVYHNGDAFDRRRINAEFLKFGIKPPKPYKSIDTLIESRKIADFTFHKLEYLSQVVNQLHRKTSHSEFHGFSLWKACLNGVVKAWDSMKKYNKKDVLATEELLNKLLPWLSESCPALWMYGDAKSDCHRCGHHGHMIEAPKRLAPKTKFHQYRCPKCGGFQKGKKVK